MENKEINFELNTIGRKLSRQDIELLSQRKSISKYTEGKNTSKTFISKANADSPVTNEGNYQYFKVDSKRGVNNYLKTFDSLGSCESIAEVLTMNIIKVLNTNLILNHKMPILRPTEYAVAEYSSDQFWEEIRKETNGAVESDRLYGSISGNCLDKDGKILRGDDLLENVVEGKANIYRSQNNNLSNYDLAYKNMQENAIAEGKEIVIDPVSVRYKANTMFLDYFTSNSDRHCKNVTDQAVQKGQTTIITPTSVLDNGGAFGMQSSNCHRNFVSMAKPLFKKYEPTLQPENEGKYFSSPVNNDLRFFAQNPFYDGQDFNVGADSFKNAHIVSNYKDLTQTEQMVLLISQNRTLFDDFKNMYQNLDVNTALQKTMKETRMPPDFFPGFEQTLSQNLVFKKMETSQIMANVVGCEFNFEQFHEDPNFYIDKFEKIVHTNETNLSIAEDREIDDFNSSIGKEISQNSYAPQEDLGQ